MSLDVNISEPDEFNCIELHNSIKCVADIKSFRDFTYHVDIVSGKGENYVANVFRVSVQETGSDQNLSVIVKTLVNTTRQELFRELHKREVSAYKEVINKFVVLQCDISIDNRIILPECIFASVDRNNEVIILEDMLLSSFTTVVKFEKIDYAQVHLIITELAKFHGLSFVLENKDNDNFTSIRDDFEDLIFNDGFLNKSKLRNYFSESFQVSLNVINDKAVMKKLELRKEKVVDLLKTYTKPRKYNVFCHGDCWINNILLKKDDTKTEVCFVDFQAMRYASPVTDILYFLYICTDSTFRSKYFTDLMTGYYETLKSFLNLFQIDAFEVYPKNDFEIDVKELLPFGLLVALMELRLVTTSDLDAVPTEDSDNPETEDIIYNSGEDLFEMRVNDVVDESLNNGVLDCVLNLIKL